MKTLLLSITMIYVTLTAARAADEKNADSLVGEYTLVSGKKFGMKVDGTSLKAKYVIDKDKITIDGEAKFVIGYKLGSKGTPLLIDMEILEGPEGTKGEKSLGIVERNGDELKLAYCLEKGKRPKDFDNKEGMSFVFKVKGK